jgi:hypothetical protein
MNRQVLIDALAAVRPGLASREILEQSGSFVFDDGMVYTYNDQISISHPVPPGITGAVRAGELYSLLTKFPDEEVQTEVTKTELVIQGKRRKAGVALQTEVRLPLDTLKGEKAWKPLPKGFADGLKFCGMSVGKDMTKPVLTSIHVKGNVMESCDNYRLGRWTLGESIADDLLIPESAADKLPAYAPTDYATSEGWIHFRNEKQVVFSARTFEGTYPDLSKLIANDGFTLELPAELPDVLERAEVLVKDEIDGMAEIGLAANALTVKARGPVGWFEEQVRVRYKGDKIEFRIRPAFLREISGKLKTVEVCPGLLKFQGENFLHACSVNVPEA